MKDRIFRVWDAEKERWLTDYEECYLCEDGVVVYMIDSGRFERNNELKKSKGVAEFSVGLKDKNGKLIFKGDIVKNNLGNIGVYQWYKDRWEIKMSDKMYSHYDTFGEHEIIGNVHQNPELL